MENHFQVVVLGTGLAESIATAGLAKAGFSVAHLDPNAYYGSGQASLTAEELIAWAEKESTSTSRSSKYSGITYSRGLPPQARQYAISLAPAIIPSTGPFIDTLVASGVARYGGYKLLEQTAIYDAESSSLVRLVPGSKEDVFKSKDMSLLDKRRLMRFLLFAAGEFEAAPEIVGHEQTPFLEFVQTKFSLPSKAADAIGYALAFRHSPQDSTLDALKQIRSVLRSSGRYGPSPFIVGHYGGSGEIAQGFCRTAAVQGAIYILGRAVKSIVSRSRILGDAITTEPTELLGDFEVDIDELPDKLTCNLILSAPDLLPSSLADSAEVVLVETAQPMSAVARGIVVLERPIHFGPRPLTKTPAELVDQVKAHDNNVPGQTADEDTPDKAEPEDQPIDTALLVFPPSSVPGGSTSFAVSAFITGEASMSTPAGKFIVYLSMPLLEHSAAGLNKTTDSAETLLRPYVTALLGLSYTDTSSPTFFTFYTEQTSVSSVNPAAGAGASVSAITSPVSTPASSTAPKVFTTPSSSPLLAEASDSAAKSGEALFWAAIGSLRERGVTPKAWGEHQDKERERDKTDVDVKTQNLEGKAEMTDQNVSKSQSDQSADAEDEGTVGYKWPTSLWPPLEARDDDDGW